MEPGKSPAAPVRAAAELYLGSGSYDLSNSLLTGGMVSLAGGEARLGNGWITNVTLNLSGTINGPLEMINSRLNLTGDLAVTSRLDQQGGETHVHGFTLGIGGNTVVDAGSWIYFEGGSVNTGLPPSISGTKVGPGFLNGNPVP